MPTLTQLQETARKEFEKIIDFEGKIEADVALSFLTSQQQIVWETAIRACMERIGEDILIPKVNLRYLLVPAEEHMINGANEEKSRLRTALAELLTQPKEK